MLKIILLLLGCFCLSMVRYFHAIQNAVIYSLQLKTNNEKVEYYKSNIHRISSPMNYLLFGGMFFIVLSINSFTFLNVIGSSLIALSFNLIQNYHWQIWINRGVGLEDFDKDEIKHTEIVLGKYHIYLPLNIFTGKKKIYYIPIAIILIVIGLFIIF